MRYFFSILAVVGLCLTSMETMAQNSSQFSEFRCGNNFVTVETLNVKNWIRGGLSLIRISNIGMIKDDPETKSGYVFLSDMNRQHGFWIRVSKDNFDRLRHCLKTR